MTNADRAREVALILKRIPGQRASVGRFIRYLAIWKIAEKAGLVRIDTTFAKRGEFGDWVLTEKGKATRKSQ